MDGAYAQVTYNITHDEALEVLLEAKSKAEADGVLVNIAVVDAGANLKAFIRMDQSFFRKHRCSDQKGRNGKVF